MAVVFLIINAVTFVVFAADKLFAKTGTYRISEKTLLLFSVFGGALGGIAAMQLCRHKTRKPIFKFGLPVMVVIHFLIFTVLVKGELI